MKRLRKFIGFLIFGIVLISFFFLWNAYNSGHVNILKAESELYLDAEMVIAHLKKENDYSLDAGKIVEVEGIIKEINNLNNRMTILLEGGANESACIICDMQADQTKNLKKFKPKDTIRLKGIFKGFLKDAIFLNCVISPKNDQ